MKRRIDGLAWAERAESPFGAAPKARGAKLAGLRFERSMVKRVSAWFPGDEVLAGPWIHYGDSNGPGFAQPDIVCLKRKIVFECKLGFRNEALIELEELYLPLCERVWGGKFQGIVLAKHWRAEAEASAPLLSDLTASAVRLGVFLA